MGTKFRVVILFYLFLVTSTLAEEAKEGHEKKPEVAPTAESRNSKELLDLEKQVASLHAKIQAKTQSVETLLKQKNEEKDPQKLTEIVKLVQQEHRDLEQLTREHNIQLGVLRYRFPERGGTQGRRYQRLSTKSLEEIERTLGLDGHLEKSRKRIKTVYGVSDTEKNRSHPSKKGEKDSVLRPGVISK